MITGGRRKTLSQIRLWRHLANANMTFPYEFLPVVRHLRSQGERLDLPELMYLQERMGDHAGPFVVPESVMRFFELLIKERDCEHVLDPAGGYGLLGAWLAANAVAPRVDVFSELTESEEITDPLNLASLKHNVGIFSDNTALLASEYDAIVTSGPVGLRMERRTYETTAGAIELTDDPACLRVADVAGHLSQNGFIAFVMTPRFGVETGARSVRQNLQRLGLHLDALLAFKPGIFSGTSIAFDLAIITREPKDSLFVASIPEDPSAQHELVSRLWNRKQGATPSQGWLVSQDEFRGLPALEAKERFEQLAKGKGLSPTGFATAVTEVRAPRRQGTDFERCEEHPNAVYLPEMALTRATTRQEDLPEKLKSYLQLLVDPEVVLPEYLAEFLNTPMGHSLRKAVMIGVTIPRISKERLKESTLYLVPIPEQTRALEAKSEILRLRNELTELESQIWEHPRQVGRVIEALGKVNHEERFEEWIETLPFPLASILRSYHALDQSDKEKYERLLHFFEALAEFVATIHLSAFRTNPVRWQQELSVLQNLMKENNLSLERATFGLWKLIVERLATSLRSMLNGSAEESAIAHMLYATADSAPLDMLSSKSLVGLLQRVNGFRNRWTGHGGAVTAAEAKARHDDLRKELEEFRSIVGVRFLQYELIEPCKAEILEGPRFRCRVRRVMGSNPQLEQNTVTIKTAAKTGSLYFHNTGHDEALELLPVVQVHDTPQPASYFYNRSENSVLHLVSYHFAETSEVSGPGAPLLALFNDFVLPRDREEGAK